MDWAYVPKLITGSVLKYCNFKLVRVNEKALGNDASPLSADVRGKDTTELSGPIDNFSLKGAHLNSEKESYALYMLFPRLSRSLLRRASEAHGAVALAPPGGPDEVAAVVAAVVAENTVDKVPDEVPDAGNAVAVGDCSYTWIFLCKRTVVLDSP